MLKINKNKLKEMKFILLIKKRLMGIKPNTKQYYKRRRFNDFNMSILKQDKRLRKFILYNWTSFGYKQLLFIKNKLKKKYKLKNFFLLQKKKINILKFKNLKLNKDTKFFKSLKQKLRLKKKVMKFMKKLNFRRNLVYKTNCIRFIYNLKKINYINNKHSKKELKKNTIKFFKLYKFKLLRLKKPAKFLNFKYRVKERNQKLIKKNLFIKKNIKRQNRIKPHFLVLRTSEANCHMNLTDSKGNTKFVLSCGHLGFKGSKRSSKYAIEKLTDRVIKKLKKYRLLNLVAKLKGYSKKHKTIFKLFIKNKIRFKGITEISVAHNGCRLKKVRRK